MNPFARLLKLENLIRYAANEFAAKPLFAWVVNLR